MDRNIFATKDDVVQTFYVTVDEKQVKSIQAQIDEWYGKGELKETTATNLMRYLEFGKKIEIVSKKYAGKGEVFIYCCPALETRDMYHYKFYQYTPHPLSNLCDNLLKEHESLDFSKYLAQLLNWTTEDEEEMQFVSQLMKSFKYKRLSVDDIVQSDLTLEEKRNILRRILDAIKNITQPKRIVVVPKSYEEEVEKQIRNMEHFNSGFFSRELHGEDFKYTSEQKKDIRRKILATLPNSDSIMK